MMLLWTLVIVVITYIAWWPFRRNPLYQDQSLHYYIAGQWLKGKIPYRDYRHSPGPMFAVLYALGRFLSRGNETGFNFFSATYLAVGNVLLFHVTLSSFGIIPALSAGLLFAFYALSPRLIGDRFPPESYTMPPVIAGFVLLIECLTAPTVLKTFSCGFCMALATLIRQSSWFYVPIPVVVFWYEGMSYLVLPYLLGLLAPHTFWMWYFQRKGALKAYMECTVWYFISLVLFGNPIGPGKGSRDPMKQSRTRIIDFLKGNSLTIAPLYLLVIACVVFDMHGKGDIRILAGTLFFGMSVLTIFLRGNFDSCYWLNSVPWAAFIGGKAFGMLLPDLGLGAGFSGCVLTVLLLGMGLFILLFDYKFYTTDPQKRDRLHDPQKVAHSSWWPTYNTIGEYIKTHTEESSRVQVLGHAARIYNVSGREAFYYRASLVLFKLKEQGVVRDYDRFFEKMKTDYPEVIVLAGHAPAFPFNPKPYLQDMEEIRRRSGIVYIVRKVIDKFPIYLADTEKSYISAVIKGEWQNTRLRDETHKISENTLGFQQDIRAGKRPEGAVGDFINALEAVDRDEDIVHTVEEVSKEKRFRFTKGEYEYLLMALGEAQYRLEYSNEAVKTFEAVLNLNPQSLEAYNNLAVVYASRGEYERACETFGAILAKDPNNKDAKENVRQLVLQLEAAVPHEGANFPPL